MSKEFLIETSARHVHISKSDLEILFGKDHQLTPVKPLSQPGQYASEERVEIVGPKRSIANVVILGPCRAQTQVEISATDARSLGIIGVIKESGDTKGTPGCIVKGPLGQIEIKEGVIVAKRHLHATLKDAEELGVKDHDVVCVQVNAKDRKLVFGDVVVRVHENFSLAMHIDTDESNAGNVTPNTFGTILKCR